MNPVSAFARRLKPWALAAKPAYAGWSLRRRAS
jgi:hypothetical protein